jgi:hypothetical protein
MAMPKMFPNRRQFLAASAPALLLPQAGMAADPEKPAEPPRPRDRRLLESPVLPQPKVVLPTDGLSNEAQPKRLAAITTAYWKYSHADDIITRFIEGYSICGRNHQPQCKVVSLYIDQFPSTDIGKGMAALYNIPIHKTITEALTLGGKELAVDGVIIVAEHGNYGRNEKGQILYPRKKWFAEVMQLFADGSKSVPVYTDKHLAHKWEDANWMYDESKKRKCSVMAGSSVPLTWRIPPVELRAGTKIESMLAVGGGDPEASGFHILELLQAFAERRPGGETGVRAVSCFKGQKAWQAAQEQVWSRQLLDSAIRLMPAREGKIEEIDKEATVFVIEYTDGFRAACYVSPAYINEYALALRLPGLEKPVATWCYLPKPQRDHFSFLCNHIEKMFRTDLPSYPVERTLLTTGMLSFLMDSLFESGKRVPTADLSKISYRPSGD